VISGEKNAETPIQVVRRIPSPDVNRVHRNIPAYLLGEDKAASISVPGEEHELLHRPIGETMSCARTELRIRTSISTSTWSPTSRPLESLISLRGIESVRR
jgi:hypothetical protein